MKNIVVIKGSPRKNGNSDMLADAFIMGAKAAGNQVEEYSIIGKQIHSCIGCNVCYNEKHECAQKDDMQACYRLLAEADVIVIATPIYFYGISSQLKCLVDRLHNPLRNDFKVRKLVLLAVCADTRKTVFDSVVTMYESVLSYFSLEDGGRVLTFGVQEKGAIKGRKELEEARRLGEKI